MQTNTIKHKLKAGGSVLGTAITDHTSPEIVTIFKAAGLDFFFIDTEHSVPSYRDIQNLVRVGRGAEVIPLVRVTQSESFLIARLLDVGAMGIVNPRIGSLEEARAVVDAMKFTPDGSRGYGLRGIINDYQYQGARAEMDSANRETMVVLQVESRECVDAIFEIAAVPGVDAFMIGPFDLSISLGIPGQFDDPVFWKAFDRVVEAANKAGVAPGVHMASAAQLKKAAERGARFLVCGSDASVLLAGYRSMVQEMNVAAAGATKTGYMEDRSEAHPQLPKHVHPPVASPEGRQRAQRISPGVSLVDPRRGSQAELAPAVERQAARDQTVVAPSVAAVADAAVDADIVAYLAQQFGIADVRAAAAGRDQQPSAVDRKDHPAAKRNKELVVADAQVAEAGGQVVPHASGEQDRVEPDVGLEIAVEAVAVADADPGAVGEHPVQIAAGLPRADPEGEVVAGVPELGRQGRCQKEQ